MESTTEATTTIQRELAIVASPETVWEFLVDPEKIVRWMGLEVSIDPRPGGVYRHQVIPGHTASGEVVEVDRPRRLVYTWGWEKVESGPNAVPPGSSTIEIELIPDGDGTTLRFEHRDLPGKESVESHTHGWDHYLARLESVAGGVDAGEDPWLSGDM